jgi:MFS family permease
LAVFEIGSLLCGVAVSSKMLIVGRAIAGIGGSGLLNGGLTIIRACVPPQKIASKRVSFQGIDCYVLKLGSVPWNSNGQ